MVKMGGYDQNLFFDLSEREAKHLSCSICLNVFNNAVTTDCSHSYCKDCIKDWVERNEKECPICKTRLTRKRQKSSATNLVIISGFVFRPNLMANGIISELKIRCQFEGCQERVEIGSFTAHLKSCEYRPKECQTCGQTLDSSMAHSCNEEVKSPDTQTIEEKSDLNDEADSGSDSEDNPSPGQAEEGQRESHQTSIQRCIANLIHASQCTDTESHSREGLASCLKMKRVIQHARQCRRRGQPAHNDPSNCPICKQLLALCCYHAKNCQVDGCPVPYCISIQTKLRQQPLRERLQNLQNRIDNINSRIESVSQSQP